VNHHKQQEIAIEREVGKGVTSIDSLEYWSVEINVAG